MVQGFQNKSYFVSYYRHESKMICSTNSSTIKDNLGRMLLIENNDISTTSS